ncbi:unnamed protein product [Miscanthus lutarioriparius]|uniref:Uncharacterized protein n=1 Tax=Miscanthus lutarioriparius TaxID=422564 RepID=A0A811RDB5_9POAL|nr:unnamed protein product [Miscanthus lutarioriparius]
MTHRKWGRRQGAAIAGSVETEVATWSIGKRHRQEIGGSWVEAEVVAVDTATQIYGERQGSMTVRTRWLHLCWRLQRQLHLWCRWESEGDRAARRVLYEGNKWCLRLQGVLCTAETYDLLQQCKLERLMFIRIISEPEVNGACLLLSWHAETLLSLEFTHCQLYPTVMDKICRSVCQKGSQSHGIQRFSIKSSQICETKPLTISSGLLNFLSSGKSLHLLSLNDTKMQSSFAQMIIHTLLESSCGLHTLEILENNIAGWLSNVNKSSTNSLALKSDIFMNSLSALNLRENNLQKDDVVDLHKILIKIPNLRDLDISGNPIMDEGIRSLIPFILWSIQKEDPLLRLTVENCELSSIGVILLLECLTTVKQPLDALSIADNHLGRRVFHGSCIGQILGSHARALNAADIGLGTLGFQILEEALPMEVALSHINIR